MHRTMSFKLACVFSFIFNVVCFYCLLIVVCHHRGPGQCCGVSPQWAGIVQWCVIIGAQDSVVVCCHSGLGQYIVVCHHSGLEQYSGVSQWAGIVQWCVVIVGWDSAVVCRHSRLGQCSGVSSQWAGIVQWCVVIVGQDSVVDTATSYRLDGPGIESWWGQNFPHLLRIGSGVHVASHTVCLSQGYSGQDVVLTTLPLWAFMASSRVNLTFMSSYWHKPFRN